MKIHQGAITHEVCCSAAQLEGILNIHQSWMIPFIFKAFMFESKEERSGGTVD
jgi:hypothetical protein